MAQTMAIIQRKSGDHSMEALHESEREWEMLRFPGQWSAMLFHPREDRPTEPNAGLCATNRRSPSDAPARFRTDLVHPRRHVHDRRKDLWPRHDDLHADPHYEEELSTETGGVMLFVRYEGPTTSGRPIYDGRFNVAARKPVSEERLDV
jgi:hypothetical protein